MPLSACLAGLIAVAVTGAASTRQGRSPAKETRPNVLFIIVDDLNDWVGVLNGHPQAHTPTMDAVARRGVNFTNAHVQAPLCNPSRASLLTGLRPSTTGIYGLAPGVRAVESLRSHVTLPEYFGQQDYVTAAMGKVYHDGSFALEDRHREFQFWGPAPRMPYPPTKFAQSDDSYGRMRVMDWGIFPERDEDQPDYQTADLAIAHLRSLPRDEPFFLAVGFRLPHVPLFASQKWFDRIPEDEVSLPPMKPGDRDDTPDFSWYLHWSLPEPRLSWYQKHNELRPFVRAYLASTTFVDAQIGRVLDGLAETGREEETIVIVTSDHGYHLGEKEISGKNTLWDRSTRVPFFIAGPGIPRREVGDPVELLDIYPTLAELAHLPSRKGLEGQSLVPQMHGTPRTRPAITTHNQGNHGIRSDRWRYIRYADGSEELYDVIADPNEWTNLVGDPKYRDVIQEMARWLPKRDVPPVPGSRSRVLTRSQDGGWLWEGEPIVASELVR